MSNIITFDEYHAKFDAILKAEKPAAPYDDVDYFNYLKLNNTRQNRWLKHGEINEKTAEVIKSIQGKQTWYLITEPWCGDAAQNVPFIYKMAQLNPNITFKIVLRDTEPFMIDDYLTNGGKSIPKLVIRDENEKDLHIWGPRPKACQDFFLSLKEKEVEFEEIKIELQKWYNEDKGATIQAEFTEMLS